MITLDRIDTPKEELYFILKHSATCPISSTAFHEIDKVEEALSVPVYLVVVQTARYLSDEIAAHFSIRHESPQLILVKDGSAVWHDSHFRITGAVAQQAIKENG